MNKLEKESVAKSIIGALSSEIQWCKKNKGIKEPEYEDGFIRGLRQAIYIIKKILL